MGVSKFPNGFNGGLEIAGYPIVGNKPGNVFWVDSTGGRIDASNGNKGTREEPFATLDYAIGRCTANNGDIIFIGPNHAEDLAADSAVDIDVAGLTIIGVGAGEDRPTFTFITDADADFKIAAANTRLFNLIFKCNIASNAMMIEVSGDDAEIGFCDFREGTATGLNFITLGVADNDSDRANIHHCKFYMPTAGNGDSAISFAKDHVGVVISDCDIYGDFDLAGIDIPAAGNAQIDLTIRDCKITNLLTGQHAIQVNGTGSTGVIERVNTVTDAYATSIDAGGLEMFNCYHNIGTDQGGWVPIGVLADSTSNILGADNNDNAFASTNVAANEDGSIIERLEQIQEAVNKGSGTALDTNKSICDALGTNGTTLVDDAGSIAGMIGFDDSNNAMSTTNVVSNPDGSVYERLEYIQKLSEILTADQLKSVAGSAMPLKIWYVDANIGASGAGTSPETAFKTIAEAIAVCTATADDWILVFDYSGGGSTITINQPFVHLIGNANKSMPYPRIKPASAVDGIEITAAGDRVEIANMVIGAGDQTKACIAIDTAAGGGAYGVYIHDCVIGRDSDAPGLLGISVPSGGNAPYLTVENNKFYGSSGDGIAAAGSAIKIAGNAVRCNIVNNYISDIGRTATPAIWLSGAVSEPRIVGNHIKIDTDTGAGSAITLSASVDDGWISGNIANDGKDAPGNNPFVDGGSTNSWGINYTGKDATLP